MIQQAHAEMYRQLRLLASALVYDTVRCNRNGRGPQRNSRRALAVQAERFMGAYDFVATITGGIPEAVRMVDGITMREIYRQATEKAAPRAKTVAL
jgi:hypothetical protein